MALHRDAQALKSTAVLGSMLATLLFAVPATAEAPEGNRMAFVVRDWFTSVYNTKFMDECPEGLSQGNDEIWWRGMTKEQRAKATDNGLVQSLNRMGPAMRRGPDGVNVCIHPNAVKDVPYRIVE